MEPEFRMRQPTGTHQVTRQLKSYSEKCIDRKLSPYAQVIRLAERQCQSKGFICKIFWGTNRNFGQKPKLWTKIEVLVKNKILVLTWYITLIKVRPCSDKTQSCLFWITLVVAVCGHSLSSRQLDPTVESGLTHHLNNAPANIKRATFSNLTKPALKIFFKNNKLSYKSQKIDFVAPTLA